MSDVRLWLEEDIRFDMDVLSKFDSTLLEEIAKESRKQQSINTLIKFLKHEKYIWPDGRWGSIPNWGDG